MMAQGSLPSPAPDTKGFPSWPMEREYSLFSSLLNVPTASLGEWWILEMIYSSLLHKCLHILPRPLQQPLVTGRSLSLGTAGRAEPFLTGNSPLGTREREFSLYSGPWVCFIPFSRKLKFWQRKNTINQERRAEGRNRFTQFFISKLVIKVVTGWAFMVYMS